VVGIYGAWGEGKTTVLNYMRTSLDTYEGVVPIFFNPWLFRGEEELLFSFFATIADTLGRKLSKRKEEIGETLTKYAGLLSPVYRGAGDAAKGIGSALSNVDITEYRDRIESILKEEGKRLVIFMDDIDRLDKTEIQSVFRLVKLSADFQYTAYVLAFDADMVAAALKERYAGSEERAGHNFLEKIIQVPLNLPPANHASLEKMCFEGVDEALKLAGIEIEESQVHEYWRAFYDGLTIRLTTPRAAKRYANAISFALPIMKGEVNPIELMLVEGLRVFFPYLYRHIHQHRDAYLCTKLVGYGSSNHEQVEELRNIREQGFVGLTEKEKVSATRLIGQIFPRTSNMGYGPDWNQTWAEQQRIASPEYFERFFSYSVPASDVSDQELRLFIEALNDKELGQDVSADLLSLLRGKEESLIRKLRSREERYSEKQSIILAKSLSRLGDILPNPEQLSFYMTPSSQAAILIAHLLKNVAKALRYKKAAEIVEIASPIYFSNEIVRWMHSDKDEAAPDRIFSKNDEKKLRKILSSRIRNEAESGQEPFYRSMPKQSPSLFFSWKWGSSKVETSKYLAARFDASPQEVVAFLMTYVPTAWSMDTGIPHKSDFTRDHYNSVAEVIDPRIVRRKLLDIFGKDVCPKEYPRLHSDVKDLDKIVAGQYCFVHAAAQKEKKQKPTSEVNQEEGA
jgi:hypothetical protein